VLDRCSAKWAALGQFQEMIRRPDTVEITFGVRLDAEVGAVIARTGVQGQLGVKLIWRASSEPLEPDGEDEERRALGTS
jgi:hypothetical protein